MIATITGRGGFPIDMLRYDECIPASEEDAGHIINSFGGFVRWTIRVRKVHPRNRFDNFTVARWESFGCKCEVQYD